MRLWASLLGLCCLPLWAAEPVVLVEWQGQYRGYFEPPRLDAVLQQASQPDTYWPAVRLYKTDADSLMQAEQHKIRVLQLLAQARQHYLKQQDEAEAQAIARLAAEIQQWRVAMPVPGTMDLDKVRTKAVLNPKLQAGHYKLLAGKRPQTLPLVGLTSANSWPLTQGLTASQLKPEVTAAADRDYLYLVTQAEVRQVGVRFWNAETVPVSPWMTALVGLDTDELPDELAEINTELVALVRYRIME